MRAIKSADTVVAETVAAIAEYKAKYRLYALLLRYCISHNAKPKKLTKRVATHLQEFLTSAYNTPVECSVSVSPFTVESRSYTAEVRCRNVPDVGEPTIHLTVLPTHVIDTDHTFLGWSNLQWYAEQMEAKLPTIREQVEQFNRALHHLQSISNVAASASNGKFDVALGPLAKHFCWYELKG